MFLIVVLNFFAITVNKYNKVKVFSSRYVAHDFRPNLGLYDLFRLGYNIDFSFVEPNEKKVVLKLKCNMISCSCVLNGNPLYDKFDLFFSAAIIKVVLRLFV